MTETWDHIIVGGGSAGCLIAAGLAARSNARVLLLEEGPGRGSPLLDFPAGYMKFLNSERYLKYYPSVPQPQLDNRSLIIPQGRILGGGSAVNAMVYMRGQHEDFASWEEAAGGAGWGASDMLTHFTAIEGNADLGAPWHGTDGPLRVSHLGHTNSVTQAFIDTCVGLGIPLNDDFNGADQAGVGRMQHTIDERARRRSSAASAFLAPQRRNPRLRVVTRARVQTLTLEGNCVVGVRYTRRGRTMEARADSQVILTAGALATPVLMMRSGLGPADDLRAAGIAVHADLAGVGRNLQDHCEVPVIASLRKGLGYHGQDRGPAMIRHGLRYLATRTGPVTSTGVESCAFITVNDAPRPNIQLYCVPTVYLDRTVSGVAPTWGMTLTPCLLRPASRGSIRLDPAAPDGPPLVDPAYLRDPGDMRTMIAAIAAARAVLRAGPLDDIVTGELLPTAGTTEDEDLMRHIRATVKTNYHPVGTCALGSVVDARLRVRGVDGLRIADSSVMPTIPSGNTNAATLAIAHKALDLLLGDT